MRASRSRVTYKLLLRIDKGYQISEADKQMLSSVKSLEWGTYKITKLPNSMGVLKNLSELRIRSKELSDISALRNLASLSTLELSNTGVSDISALRNLASLSTLELSNTGVSDISVLRNLTSLSTLELSNTGVSDISVLRNLTSLSTLNLSNTQVNDISALSGLKSLHTLDLSGIKIKDLSALSGLCALKRLNIQNSKTTSIPKCLLDFNLNFITEQKEYVYYYGEGIYIHGLTLTDQPIEIFSQRRELIRAYYREGEQVPVNEC